MGVDKYAKALIGAVTAGLGAYGAAVADGAGVTVAEWVAIAVATIGAFALVWGVPNAPATPVNSTEWVEK